MKRRLFKNSAILYGLGRAADGLYDAMAKSAAGRALTSYDTETRDAEKSLIATKVSSFYRRLKLSRIKRFFAHGVENSLICEKVRAFFASLLSTPVRNYGIFFLAFGFYGMLMFLLTNYAVDRLPAVSVTYFTVDIAVMLSALPMIFSRKKLLSVFSESRIFNALFFGILGLRREGVGFDRKEREIGASTAFISGTVFGIMTLFVSPITILLIFLFLVGGYQILITPESGIVLTALLLPFVHSNILGYLLIYIVFCYLLKLFRGKRTLVLDLKDYAILLFAVSVLLGGIFSIDVSISFTYSVKLVVFILGYILVVNLIRSRRWLDRLKASFVISVIITAIIGIVQYLAITSVHYLSEDAYVGNEVTAFFSSSKVLALYLCLGLFFVLAELIKNDNTIRKLFIFLTSIAVIVCIYLTSEPIIMLAAVISSGVFFLIYSNRTVYVLLAVLLALPLGKFIMPPSVNSEFDRLSMIATDHIEGRIPIWNSSLSMANDYFFSGSGIGTYRILFESYVNETLGFASDSANLYLQTVIEIGIFGLMVFLIVALLFMQHSFSIFASEGGGRKTVVTAAGVAGVITVFLAGMVCNVWSDSRIFLCFWLVMGIATANSNLQISSRRGISAYLDNNR